MEKKNTNFRLIVLIIILNIVYLIHFSNAYSKEYVGEAGWGSFFLYIVIGFPSIIAGIMAIIGSSTPNNKFKDYDTCTTRVLLILGGLNIFLLEGTFKKLDIVLIVIQIVQILSIIKISYNLTLMRKENNEQTGE